MKDFTTLGTTTDVQTCWCCGKEDLSKTVVMRNNHSGTVEYFGTTCATRLSGYKSMNTGTYHSSEQVELAGRYKRVLNNPHLPENQKEVVLRVLKSKMTPSTLRELL